jgi:predicted dehydrogenase
LHDLGVEDLVVCDADAAKLSDVRRKYPGISTTTQFDDLLTSDVAGIVIATPVSTHFPLAKAALLHGKDVLVEKPLTKTLAQAEELVEIAEAREAVLMVGHTFVYNPAVEAVRDLIAAGELGEIYYLDSSRLNLGLFQQDANVLWDLAPHDLSILNYVVDSSPSHVTAWGAGHVNHRLLDNAHLNLTYPNGTRAHVHVSWLEPCKVRRTTVVGTRKMVVFDDVAATEKVWVYDKGITLQYDTDDYRDFHLSYRYGHTTILHTPLTEPLQREQRHFMDCIKRRNRPTSDGFAGAHVVSLLECAEHSIANHGASVNATFPEPVKNAPLGAGLKLIRDVRATRVHRSNGAVAALVGDVS